MDVDRNYRVATFFMSDDMGLLHEYLQKRIFRDLFLQSNLEESYFQNFKNDMTEKSKLMNDLIKAECSKESLAKSLMYESFFDFDLKFSSRLQDLENWRLKNASVFDAMKNYVESH
jgi:hypothetical protein